MSWFVLLVPNDHLRLFDMFGFVESDLSFVPGFLVHCFGLLVDFLLSALHHDRNSCLNFPSDHQFRWSISGGGVRRFPVIQKSPSYLQPRVLLTFHCCMHHLDENPPESLCDAIGLRVFWGAWSALKAPFLAKTFQSSEL